MNGRRAIELIAAFLFLAAFSFVLTEVIDLMLHTLLN